ncbi:MAG: spore germination protein [Bacteroidota bacterium]
MSLALRPLTGNYRQDLALFEEALAAAGDIVYREIVLTLSEPVRACLIFTDTLVDHAEVNEHLLEPLLLPRPDAPQDTRGAWLSAHVLTMAEVSLVAEGEEIVRLILSGETALLIEGECILPVANTRGWARRGVEEPPTEAVVRGPRVGLNEVFKNNIGQVRRWIRDPRLTVRVMTVGRRSKTDVAVLHLGGVADPRLVRRVEERLSRLDVDAVVDSTQLEEYLEDGPYSFFPTLLSTERADRVVAALLEGRVSILADNSPSALIAPVSFWELYHSAEDYYQRWTMGSFLRLLRFVALGVALFLPGVFLALANFNPELLPFRLTMSMAASRAALPFPLLLEMLAMEFGIELLREASVRLPGPFSATIGIVGGFILGDAAVRAGLTNSSLTVVVALTAVASFTAPSFGATTAVRLLRFAFTIAAGFYGFFGLALGAVLLLWHLGNQRSFGRPYLSPFVPLRAGELKDSLVRLPFWTMVTRPGSLEPADLVRQRRAMRYWWRAFRRPPGRRGDRG